MEAIGGFVLCAPPAAAPDKGGNRWVAAKPELVPLEVVVSNPWKVSGLYGATRVWVRSDAVMSPWGAKVWELVVGGVPRSVLLVPVDEVVLVARDGAETLQTANQTPSAPCSGCQGA